MPVETSGRCNTGDIIYLTLALEDSATFNWCCTSRWHSHGDVGFDTPNQHLKSSPSRIPLWILHCPQLGGIQQMMRGKDDAELKAVIHLLRICCTSGHHPSNSRAPVGAMLLWRSVPLWLLSSRGREAPGIMKLGVVLLPAQTSMGKSDKGMLM